MRARKMIAAGMLVVGLGAACGPAAEKTEKNLFGAEVPKGCAAVNAEALLNVGKQLEALATPQQVEVAKENLTLMQENPECFDPGAAEETAEAIREMEEAMGELEEAMKELEEL